MIRIYIPTMGRVDRQTTWDNLPPKAQQNCLLVCPSAEVKAHTALGRKCLPFDKKGISRARDYAVRHAAGNGRKAMVMFDDDLTFQRRRADGKITDCSMAETDEALDWLEEKVRGGYAHAGLSTRFLGFAHPTDEMEPSRMMHALAMNASLVVRLGLSYALGDPDTWAIDDCYMTLQLLTRGYPNVVSAVHRISTNGSNAKGGASLWRTAAQQTENAQRLAAAFPNFVKTREKAAWKGMESKKMLDVTIRWQKALKYGLAAREKK